MFRALLISAVLVLPFHGYSIELGFWPELVMLHEADLAIDAALVRHDEAHFWVKVGTVLRDTGFGIKAGDVIRVKNGYSHSCGFPWLVDGHRRWRLYLQKDEGKGNWSLKDRNADCAIGIHDGQTTIFMPRDINLPVDEFDRCLLEFQTCYAMDDTGWTFHTTATEARIAELAATNAIIAEFEQVGRTVRPRYLFEEPPIEEPPMPRPPAEPMAEWECPLLEEPPSFANGGGPEAFDAFRKDRVRDPVPEDDVHGNVFVRILIDAEGNTTEPSILRGLGPEYDGEVMRLVGEFPQWRPGKHRGIATACYMNLPFRFELPE